MLNDSKISQMETGQACRPDPEAMLQNARVRRVKAEEVLNKYKDFVISVDYLNHDNEQAALKTLGELTLKLWGAEKEEQRWLEEIDK